MQTKLLLIAVLLLITTHSAILPTLLDTTILQNPLSVQPITIDRLTVPVDVYYGSTQIKIENGDYSKIQFYGTLANDTTSPCAYSRCYYGWINNYTILGEPTVVGYANETLTIKPVFEFKTNSQDDFVIVRNQQLDQTWTQIIQILCEKINPQITQQNPISDRAQASATTQKFEYSINPTNQDLSLSLPTSDTIQEPEQSLYPKYTFKTIQASDLSGTSTLNLNTNLFSIKDLTIGDKISSSKENIPLEDIKTSTSAFSETLVLSKDNLVKNRALEYQIRLPSSAQLSEKGQKVSDFFGNIQINFKYAQKTTVSQLQSRKVKEILSTTDRASFDLKTINERRSKLSDVLEPKFNFITDNGPSYEDAQVKEFIGEKYTGVNVVDKLNGKVTTLDTSTAISLNTFTRNLQVLQNYTVYNYKKTLFSTSIFGKTFKTQVDVKCNILIYSNDHQIQCFGVLNYQLFGKTKSLSIFSFKKSVSYAWSWNRQFKGTWGFGVYIPLPPPVSFIGLNFRFDVSYVIDIKININAGGLTPYQIKAVCLASTKVNTDASAAVRVVVIEGGVFISGTLVQVGTDPRVTLSYYFDKKAINILAQWYFWISAFKYNWGFFYRTWRLFKGWSSRKIIKQWTINGVYGKWVIVNRSWDIYL